MVHAFQRSFRLPVPVQGRMQSVAGGAARDPQGLDHARRAAAQSHGNLEPGFPQGFARLSTNA